MKNSKNQNTIKNLKEELKSEREARKRVENNYYLKGKELDKAQGKIETYENAERLLIEFRDDLHQAEIDRLMRIIKLLIKPSVDIDDKPKSTFNSTFPDLGNNYDRH